MLGRFCTSTWSLQMKVNGVSRQCKLFKLAVHFAKCSCKATTIKTLLVLNLFTHIQYSIVNIYTYTVLSFPSYTIREYSHDKDECM